MREVRASIAVALLAGAVLAGCTSREDGKDDQRASATTAVPAAVTLLAADEPGANPFGPSVGVSLVGSIERDVRDVLDRTIATESVLGSASKLYGRIDLKAPCDIDDLVAYYGASEERTRIVAEVLGVSTGSLSSFIRSYVAVAITRDTLVIDHQLVHGAAVDVPVVLQAGTAVLIDPQGTPRVRCESANPLTHPGTDDLAAATGAEPLGEPWPGFDPGHVVVVEPAAENMQELDLAELHE